MRTANPAAAGRRPPRRAWLALTALVVACRCGGGAAGSDAAGPETPATPDPTSLVLVYSYTGRTAALGGEIAAMTGARLVRRPAPPDSDETPPAGEPLDLAGVTRLYLGFPIRTGAPAAAALAGVDALRLDGVEVVPFYTYLHHADPGALAAFAERVRARGGVARPALGVRVPFTRTAEELRREGANALLGRADLWPAEAPATRGCHRPDATAAERCGVPAGFVWVGDDGSSASPPGAPSPRRRRVDAFELDRTEVTVEQYRRCSSAGRCPAIEPGNTSVCTALVGSQTAVPMPCAGLDEAQAYCAFVGGRVPEEAEWLRAARGSSMRAYPWGDDPPSPGHAPYGNYGEKPATGLPTYAVVPADAAWPDDGQPGLAPGCRFPAGDGPFGHCDLTGNLAEWTLVVGPAGAATEAALKGGSWLDGDATSLRLAARGYLSLEHALPARGFYVTGFRCAYDAKR